MEFEQVKFRTYDGEPDAELGGIAVFRYGNLLGVICGCCGSWHPAKNVRILEEYEYWLDFGSAIVAFNEAAEMWPDDEV